VETEFKQDRKKWKRQIWK